MMAPSLCREEFAYGGQRCTAAATSKQMPTPFGIIRASDWLIWKDGGTQLCGESSVFAQFHRDTQPTRVEVVCVARRFDQLADGWRYDHGTHVCVSAAAVGFTVSFVQDGNRIMLLIPNL